jgi:acylphosphatase
VEIHVEGDKGPVSGFLKELKIGPKWSRIGKFQIEWLPYEGEFESFSVRF